MTKKQKVSTENFESNAKVISKVVNEAEVKEELQSETQEVNIKPSEDNSETLVTDTPDSVNEELNTSTPIEKVEKESTVVSNETKAVEIKTDDKHPRNLPGRLYHQYDQLTGRNLSRINTILDYLEKMKPGQPVDVNTGGRLQVSLFKTLQGIINTEPVMFEKTMTLFLGLYEDFSKEGRAFHPRFINRFHEVMNLNSEERKSFALWHAAFLKLANPNGRKQAVKMIDLNKVFHHGLTEEGRQRITSFFLL